MSLRGRNSFGCVRVPYGNTEMVVNDHVVMFSLEHFDLLHLIAFDLYHCVWNYKFCFNTIYGFH